MFLIRVLIIGDTGVGKTSLLVRFNEGTFTLNQKTTIGVDYKAKEVVISRRESSTSPAAEDDEVAQVGSTSMTEATSPTKAPDHVKLQIWDTAGQERFRSMTAAFYNKAQGVVLAFDVSQRDTFQSLSTWIADVGRDAPAGCVVVLCANKVDIDESLWQVRREEFTALAKQHGFPLFEASGKTGAKVNDMFIELGRVILERNRSELQEVGALEPSPSTPGGNIVLTGSPVSESKKKKSRPQAWCSL